MNQTGHVKLHCKIQDWEWYSTPYMFHLFMHLVMCANTEDRKRNGRIVRRGQVLTTLSRLVEETGISKRSIRTCLERLKATGEIQIETTKLFSIITVENYGSYQIESEITEEAPVKTKEPVQTELQLVVPESPAVEAPVAPVKKPKKKSEPKTPSIITLAREVFENYFNETYEDVYYWTAKDAGQMRMLLNKIKYRRTSKGMPVEESDLIESLSALLHSITDQWLCSNFSVANIASKYNEIVAQAQLNYNKHGNVRTVNSESQVSYEKNRRLQDASDTIRRLEEEED